MAAMTTAAAMPATRASFATKRASKTRVVRRGVVAQAGKRGTYKTSHLVFFPPIGGAGPHGHRGLCAMACGEPSEGLQRDHSVSLLSFLNHA